MNGKRLLAVLLCGLLLAGVCGCGDDGGDVSDDRSDWLTETSVENPDAWFTVSVLPIE